MIKLSDREEEVAALVARGCSNKEIAASLGIAVQTVKIHVHSIFRRLGVSSRVEVAMYILNRQVSESRAPRAEH